MKQNAEGLGIARREFGRAREQADALGITVTRRKIAIREPGTSRNPRRLAERGGALEAGEC